MLENILNNYIIQPISFGFGLVTFILLYFKAVMKMTANKLIASSITIIKYFGIFYLLVWIVYLINDNLLTERLNGKYWWSMWLLMLTYPLLSQLFWIKKVKNSNFLTYLISILFLTSNLIFSGKIVCFDGDCDIHSFFVGIFKEIGIYILILISITYLVKNEK